MKPEMSQGKKWSWEPEPRAEPGSITVRGQAGTKGKAPGGEMKVMSCPPHELGP